MSCCPDGSVCVPLLRWKHLTVGVILYPFPPCQEDNCQDFALSCTAWRPLLPVRPVDGKKEVERWANHISPLPLSSPWRSVPLSSAHLLQSLSDVIGARASLTCSWMCMLHSHSFFSHYKSVGWPGAGWRSRPRLYLHRVFSPGRRICAHESCRLRLLPRWEEKQGTKWLFCAYLASLRVSVCLLTHFFHGSYEPDCRHPQDPLCFHCAWALKQTQQISPACIVHPLTRVWPCLLFSRFHSALRAPRACWGEWFAPLIFTNCAPPAPPRPPRWAWRVPARWRFLQNLQPRSAVLNSPPFSLWWPLAPTSAESTRGTRCTPLTRLSAWLRPRRHWAGPVLFLRMRRRSVLCRCLENGLNPERVWVSTPLVSFNMKVNLSKVWKHKIEVFFYHLFMKTPRTGLYHCLSLNLKAICHSHSVKLLICKQIFKSGHICWNMHTCIYIRVKLVCSGQWSRNPKKSQCIIIKIHF